MQNSLIGISLWEFVKLEIRAVSSRVVADAKELIWLARLYYSWTLMGLCVNFSGEGALLSLTYPSRRFSSVFSVVYSLLTLIRGSLNSPAEVIVVYSDYSIWMSWAIWFSEVGCRGLLAGESFLFGWALDPNYSSSTSFMI
jgi:hypothetical protein